MQGLAQVPAVVELHKRTWHNIHIWQQEERSSITWLLVSYAWLLAKNHDTELHKTWTLHLVKDDGPVIVPRYWEQRLLQGLQYVLHIRGKKGIPMNSKHTNKLVYNSKYGRPNRWQRKSGRREQYLKVTVTEGRATKGKNKFNEGRHNGMRGLANRHAV